LFGYWERGVALGGEGTKQAGTVLGGGRGVGLGEFLHGTFWGWLGFGGWAGGCVVNDQAPPWRPLPHATRTPAPQERACPSQNRGQTNLENPKERQKHSKTPERHPSALKPPRNAERKAKSINPNRRARAGPWRRPPRATRTTSSRAPSRWRTLRWWSRTRRRWAQFFCFWPVSGFGFAGLGGRFSAVRLLGGRFARGARGFAAALQGGGL
jgi:hypothetical protein